MDILPAVFVTNGRAACGLLLGAGLLWALPVVMPAQGSVPSTRARGATGGHCVVREVSRERLSVGRSLVYVEPVAFVASGEEILLAGTPNYAVYRDAGGALTGAARDSIFGVILERDGGARAVPAPPPVAGKRFAGVRAVARPGGGWEVVFAEMPPGVEFPDTGRVARLWYGMYDGRGSVGLDTLALPAAGEVSLALRIPDPSAFIRWGDTLALAMLVTPANHLSIPVLFERRSGRWSVEVVPPIGRATGVSYVALAHSDSAGLLLAAVHPDPALRHDQNSLFLYARRPAWHVLRRVVYGLSAAVHDPILALAPGGGTLTWLAHVQDTSGGRMEARMMVGRLEAGDEPAMMLDSTAMTVAPVVTRPGERLWVSYHVAPSNVHAGADVEIRFLREAGSSVAVIGRIPNPFTGGANAIALTPSDILLSGPFLDRSFHPTLPTLVTLLLRARVECGARPGPKTPRRAS